MGLKKITRTRQLSDDPKEKWKPVPGYSSRQGYYQISGENRPVDLPIGSHTSSIEDATLSHSPEIKTPISFIGNIESRNGSYGYRR